VSVGFGGETKVWAADEKGEWVDDGKIMREKKLFSLKIDALTDI
jgi:hypothetical protein